MFQFVEGVDEPLEVFIDLEESIKAESGRHADIADEWRESRNDFQKDHPLSNGEGGLPAADDGRLAVPVVGDMNGLAFSGFKGDGIGIVVE